MLFKERILEGIRSGDIDVAFRLWNEPRVQKNSRLRTPIGIVEIVDVEAVPEEDVAAEEIERAGYASRAEMMKELGKHGGRTLYRIALRYAGTDPRETLREQDALTDDEMKGLLSRLAKMDKSSRRGPWTSGTLAVIGRLPGVRAAELAVDAGWETEKFKLNVRKLKELGLTISLGTGYRLSPRGEAVMKAIRAKGTSLE